MTLDAGWKYLLKTVVNDWVYLGNESFPKLFGAKDSNVGDTGYSYTIIDCVNLLKF